MNLSKAFDCAPPDLLLTKFVAHGVVESFLCYIFLPPKSETMHPNQ